MVLKRGSSPTLFLSADCDGKKPLEGPLKEELEEALATAERFTQQYTSLLQRMEEQLFNTSSILDMFNKQFGWVSTLANSTKDGLFRVKAVRSLVIPIDGINKPGTILENSCLYF